MQDVWNAKTILQGITVWAVLQKSYKQGVQISKVGRYLSWE